MCDLLHAAPFQNILPRVYIKGIQEGRRAVNERQMDKKIDVELPASSPVPIDLCLIFVQNVQLPLCVCVLYRGRETGGEDEEAGSEVRPSAPRASN